MQIIDTNLIANFDWLQMRSIDYIGLKKRHINGNVSFQASRDGSLIQQPSVLP